MVVDGWNHSLNKNRIQPSTITSCDLHNRDASIALSQSRHSLLVSVGGVVFRLILQLGHAELIQTQVKRHKSPSTRGTHDQFSLLSMWS